MFKFIKRIYFKLQLKAIERDELALDSYRAELVYKPPLDEIPERLERLQGVSKELKKLKKKKKKLIKKLVTL